MVMGISVTVQAQDERGTPTGKMQPLLELDQKDKDWKIMFGVKAWSNEWDLPIELRAYDKTRILEFESDAALTSIPALLVWYRKFFIGGSYLLDTDYDFTPQQFRNWSRSEDDQFFGYTYDIDISGSRKEWDLNIGYSLTPNIAVSLGYKSLERDLSLTLADSGDSDNYLRANYPLSVKAPIIGISASAPVGDKFNLYGNLAYGWLSGEASYETTTDTNDLDVDGTYVLGELGFGYVIPLQHTIVSAVTINAGYRFQRLDMTLSGKDWGDSGDQHDSTAGFVLGASAFF
jgi:opacity protein-like surface antigen